MHVPCLIYNPLFIAPRVVENITSHIDVAQTVLGLLKIDYRTTNLGRNVLSLPNEYTGHALVQEEETIGLIWNDRYLVQRLGARPHLYAYRSGDPTHDLAQEEPEVAADLSEKARSLDFVANDMILNLKVLQPRPGTQ
jgi:arylsulfatase A-like enzyme